MIVKSGLKHVVVGDRMHQFAAGYLELQALVSTMHDIKIVPYVGKNHAS
jgi:hypothetical protein